MNQRNLSLLLLSLMLHGCFFSEDPGQSLAKVNGEVITSYQFQTLVEREQRDLRQAISQKEIANKMIDQELAIQKAKTLKLDRRPDVLASIEMAKREILAGAYAEQLAQSIPLPKSYEIQSYYEAHPLLFSDRSIYQLQMLRLPLQLRESEEFVAVLREDGTFQELTAVLDKLSAGYALSRQIRTAEQLPTQALERLNSASSDELVVFETQEEILVYNVQARTAAPLSIKESSQRISEFLHNQEARNELQIRISALRANSDIELHGEFANLLETSKGG